MKTKAFVEELRQQSEQEIEKTLISLLEEKFKLKMAFASGQETKTHKFGEISKRIARAKTILKEKQGN